MVRKLHTSKSHKRRNSCKQTRRHTRKRGGTSESCSMRGQFGGRGGMGGADLGHAFTTGASQELYQITGRTPGLSSGGGKGNKNLATRRAAKAAKLAAQAAHLLTEDEILNNESNMGNYIISPPLPPSRLSVKAASFEPQYIKNARNFNELMRKVNKNRMLSNKDARFQELMDEINRRRLENGN